MTSHSSLTSMEAMPSVIAKPWPLFQDFRHSQWLLIRTPVSHRVINLPCMWQEHAKACEVGTIGEGSFLDSHLRTTAS